MYIYFLHVNLGYSNEYPDIPLPPPMPALAGYIVQKKEKDIGAPRSAMNKMLPGPVPTTTIVIARARPRG
jgi:hypothetical protein